MSLDKIDWRRLQVNVARDKLGVDDKLRFETNYFSRKRPELAEKRQRMARKAEEMASADTAKAKFIPVGHGSLGILKTRREAILAYERANGKISEMRDEAHLTPSMLLARSEYLKESAARIIGQFTVDIWASFPNPEMHLRDPSVVHDPPTLTYEAICHYVKRPHFICVDGRSLKWIKRFEMYFAPPENPKSFWSQGWELPYREQYFEVVSCLSKEGAQELDNQLWEHFRKIGVVPASCATSKFWQGATGQIDSALWQQ
ncbi:uncharacterized protein VTP21DRAFT_9698 [Calcarisporiella thermophila]|uniref:uncharacterized protein n=1 Tax=Calcarisporiella thermophila TaxID=911321 RepID=UPI003743E8E6